MQAEQPLLSIGIPTYNRAACLALLLKGIEEQIQDDRVELIVSDNASQDATAETVAGFQQRGMKIQYIRNAENLGADANILQCYQRARGEYAWIIGDDDVVVPGGLAYVLHVLEARRYDLIYLPSYGFVGEYVAPVSFNTPRAAVPFASALHFTLRYHVGLTFLSGNIFRKQMVEQMPHRDFAALVDTSLVQLAWILTLLSGTARCAVIKDKLIAAKMENGGGHGTCKVFGERLHAIVEEYLGANSPVGRAILNRTLQSWFPWALLEARRGKSSAHFEEDPEAILGSLYRHNYRYWVFLLPVLKLPVPLARLWLLGVRIVNRLDGSCGYALSR